MHLRTLTGCWPADLRSAGPQLSYHSLMTQSIIMALQVYNLTPNPNPYVVPLVYTLTFIRYPTKSVQSQMCECVIVPEQSGRSSSSSR